VIDDEADVREALKVLLDAAGYESRSYASAEEFLSAEKLAEPSCLLVDVRLPGMTGLELVRQLQAHSPRPVVVMITGHGDVPMAVKARRARCIFSRSLSSLPNCWTHWAKPCSASARSRKRRPIRPRLPNGTVR
jgi:DNA-binding NtrC family response regulator